jgi:hypothetical protein
MTVKQLCLLAAAHKPSSFGSFYVIPVTHEGRKHACNIRTTRMRFEVFELIQEKGRLRFKIIP